MPIHRGLYRAWWFSQNIEEIEGIGLERDLTGIPVIYLGDDATMKGTNSDFSLAQELVRNLRVDEQAGIVIPKKKLGTSNDGNGILLELLSTTGRRNYNTTENLERYDKRKALSVLAQFIMLGMDKVGSFALSKNQNDLFVIAVTAWLQSIADTINMYAIPRLMAYNSFPGITGNPQLVPGILSSSRPLSATLQALAELYVMPARYFCKSSIVAHLKTCCRVGDVEKNGMLPSGRKMHHASFVAQRQPSFL